MTADNTRGRVLLTGLPYQQWENPVGVTVDPDAFFWFVLARESHLPIFQGALMKSLFFLPSRNLAITVPIVLVAGFFLGLFLDTSLLNRYVLWVSVFMVYPSMIGFTLRDLATMSDMKLTVISLGINFLLVPILAYTLGVSFLLKEPQLFAGLAIMSILPTSNMTVAFTMMGKGNVPAAVKLAVTCLVLGALLAPWYLLVMIGRYVPIDLLDILRTVVTVVFLPLIMGVATYYWLMKHYTQEQFSKRIKPYLPAATVWGLIYILITSASTNARRIVASPDLLLLTLGVLAIFYFGNLVMPVLVGRRLFDRKEAITLVFTTLPRNLAISVGLTATAFGPKASLVVALAFVWQSQGAAWFIRLNERLNIFPTKAPVPKPVEVATR
ncbi:MAG: arsenic resistance protein [Chloroflexota bacterium]